MKPKSVIAIVLLVLMLQPIAAGLTAGLEEFTNAGEPKSIGTPSQEPGSRLEPGEYANHVVFSIDGDAEFAAMGWPGAGTSGDPYIIAGLSITADIGQICIQIWNTDAYFIIRDCFINQLSSYRGIEIVNTSHATIEYTTVYSEFNPIFFMNANNTLVSHVFSYGTNGMALEFQYSEGCTVEYGYFEGINNRGLLADYCNYFSSSNNEYITTSLNYAVRIDHSNYSSSAFDITTASDNTGLAVWNSFYFTGSDLTATGGTRGFSAIDSPEATFSRCYVGSTWGSPGEGTRIWRSPNSTVEDCTFYDTSTNAIQIDESNNTIVTGNYVETSGASGIYVTLSYFAEISMNTILDTSNYGIYVTSSSDVVLDSNTVSGTGNNGLHMSVSDRPVISNFHQMYSLGMGINVETCHNGSLADSSISYTFQRGVTIESSDNWVVTDNTFSYTSDSALYVTSGANVQILRNDFADLSSEGIEVRTSNDGVVSENTMTRVDSFGIDCFQTDRIAISDNVLTDCYDGIDILGGINVTVTSNTVTGFWGFGVRIENHNFPYIYGNTLNAHYGYGISIENIAQGIFSYNTMTDCGFYFVSGTAFLTYNQSIIGNTVNSLPVYYGWTVNDTAVDASNYGQIIFGNSTYIDITAGEFTRSTTAIQLLYCAEVDIAGQVITDQIEGILVEYSPNVTIVDSVINGMNRGRGINVMYSVGFGLESSDISRTFDDGLSLVYSDNFTVIDCHFEDIDGEALSSYYTNFGEVLDSEFFNATYGIYGYWTQQMNMSGNHIKWCDRGIYTTAISDVNYASFNNIHDNIWGMYLFDSYSWVINNNTVQWNDVGIELDVSIGETIFFNIFAGNVIYNGFDDQSNAWDNHVDTGNWWDDYTPPGVYNIPGPGSGVDNYPMQYLITEPMINDPPDLYYAEGSTGNTLSWIVLDDSLRDWEVTIDGSLWAADAWNLVGITVNVDGLAYGSHAVTITVWDVDQNSVSDSLQIHVFDGTPPTISSQPHGIAFVDGSGQTVMWEASDAHPDTYTVFMDGEVFTTGSWTSGPIEINIDGQTEGEHNFYMVVRDLDGNSAGDTVRILFIDDNTDPTIDSPADITYTFGETGNSIIWTPMDEYPDRYEVRMNGSVVASGNWGGSRVAVVVDGLAVGEHDVQLTVYDGSGQSASDTVMVTVEAVIPSGPPPLPIDLGLLLLVAGVAGGVIVIVLVVYLIRKKRAG